MLVSIGVKLLNNTFILLVKNAEKRAILFESDLFNTLTHEVLDINLTITFQLLIYCTELVITMNIRGLKIFPLTYHEIIYGNAKPI